MPVPRDGMVKVVWNESGECHAVWGKPEDDDGGIFVRLRLVDGTRIEISKACVVKIETPQEAGG